MRQTLDTSCREFCYRITYQILGRLRFLSHKELMRVIVRVFRRARVPVAYSQGYHPHPLFSFGPPRPVGMAGIAEQMDVRCTAAIEPVQLAQEVNAASPHGLAVVAVAPLTRPAAAITASVSAATYECEWPRAAVPPGDAIEALLARREIVCSRTTGRGTRMSDIRPGIYELRWNAPVLQMRLALTPTCYVRPQDVLAALTGWPDDTIRRITLTRTGFQMETGATPEQHATRNPD